MKFESIRIVTSRMSYMSYRSPTPRLPVNNEEQDMLRSNSVSPVLNAPIVIPPIIIPDVPTDKVRPYAPYARPVIHTMTVEPSAYSSPPIVQKEEPRPRLPNCLCGYTKIIMGYIGCPIICSVSCLAGTGYTIYHGLRCNCDNNDALNYRDTFCTNYGCGTAYTISYRLIESGMRDIRPTVQQDMFR